MLSGEPVLLNDSSLQFFSFYSVTFMITFKKYGESIRPLNIARLFEWGWLSAWL